MRRLRTWSTFWLHACSSQSCAISRQFSVCDRMDRVYCYGVLPQFSNDSCHLGCLKARFHRTCSRLDWWLMTSWFLLLLVSFENTCTSKRRRKKTKKLVSQSWFSRTNNVRRKKNNNCAINCELMALCEWKKTSTWKKII